MELADLDAARLRVLEEPVGRPRRRGPRARRGAGPGAHPAQAARDRRRLRPPRRGRDRDQAPHPVRRRWSSGASWTCCATSAGTRAGLAGAGDELLVDRAAAGRAAGARRCRLVMLVERAQHWPMLRRVIGRRLDRRPGHRGAARPPRAGPPDRAAGTSCTCGPSTPRSELAAVPGPRGDGGHQRPAGVHAGAARRYRFPRHGKSSRTKARDTTAARPAAGRGRPPPALPLRLRPALQGLPRCRRRRARRLRRTGPFEGMPSECDVVALRELVPAATAPLTLQTDVGDGRSVQLCSLLPMAAPAMVRESGQIWLGPAGAAQLRRPGPRPRRGAAQGAASAEPGIVGLTDPPGEGPRLQDLVTDDSLDDHRPRRLRLLDRRRRGQGRHGRRPRAGQRRGHARPPG